MNSGTPEYRKNESNREMDDFERANDDSAIRVFTGDEKSRMNGPLPATGAAHRICNVRQGVVGSWRDDATIIDNKSGKARDTESNPAS